MPLLLANFIYSRDCKLNLRKNVDTTVQKSSPKPKMGEKYLSNWGLILGTKKARKRLVCGLFRPYIFFVKATWHVLTKKIFA